MYCKQIDIPDDLAWIWCDCDVQTPARMAHFRLPFRSTSGPVTWTGFADTFYTIYINGVALGIGPTLGIHTMPRLTTWDLTAHIGDGDNVLAIEVWYDRAAIASDADVDRAGLIGWLKSNDSLVSTGPDWKSIAGSSFAVSSAAAEGFAAKRVVIGDLRDESREWTEVGFDDSWWPSATVASNHPDEIRGILRPSPIPALTCQAIRPRELIDVGIAREGAVVVNAEDVAKHVIAQSHASLVRPTHTFSVLADDGVGVAWGLPSAQRVAALGWPQDVRSVFTPPLPLPVVDGDCYIVWDMGVQTSGSVWLDIDCAGEASIDFAYADHLQYGRVNPRLQSHSFADRLIVGPGRQTIHVPHERGFRYLQLTISSPATIYDVRVDEHVYPHDDIVRFRCSDPTLNAIWDLAVATLHQCSLTSHCDNARRERQGWGGPDLYAQTHAFNAAFGDTRLTGKMLEDYCDFFDENGFVPNYYPATKPAVRWIPAHDLWFPTACWDYIVYSADRVLTPRLLSASEAVLDFYSGHRDGGLFAKEYDKACRWAEWNMNAAQNVSTWETLLAVVGYRSLAQLRQYAGAGNADEASQCADRLAEEINGRLWHAGQGALAQGTRDDGSLVDHCGQLDNAFAILHGILHPHRVQSAYRFCAGQSGTWPTCRSDWQGSSQGERVRFDPRKPVVTGTPFGSSLCAQTMMGHGDAKEAIQYIRYNFGAMLDEGEGTLWEMWPIHQDETISSTCFSQAYGAHIASTFIRCILGVSFASPGGSELIWHPNPCGLEWVEGRIDTVHGPATFRVDENGAASDVPPAVRIIRPA